MARHRTAKKEGAWLVLGVTMVTVLGLLSSGGTGENSELYNRGTEDLQNKASPDYLFRLKSSVVLLITKTNSLKK